MDRSNNIIAIIDDEPNIRETAAFILQMEGYDVVKACNGEEGLEQILKYQPKLILLDVMMPKMDGYELCKILKHDPELKSTYIVMLTAKGQKIDEDKAIQMGADAYMTKPFDAEEVMWHIARVFKQNS